MDPEADAETKTEKCGKKQDGAGNIARKQKILKCIQNRKAWLGRSA